MLSYQRVQKIVLEYQAKYEQINYGVLDVRVAQQTRCLMLAL